jgi:hypothetical protein
MTLVPIASSAGFASAKSAADHARQCPGGGAADPARDRRIDKADAALGEAGGDALRGGRVDRRHVDAEAPRGDAFENAAGAEIGGVHIAR